MRQAEDTRLRITGLRTRRDGTALDKAETKAQQRINDLAILVIARREPDRIGQVQPGKLRTQDRVGHRRRHRHQPGLERFQAEAMRHFRREGMECLCPEFQIAAHVERSSGSIQPPSSPLRKSRTVRTAIIGSSS